MLFFLYEYSDLRCVFIWRFLALVQSILALLRTGLAVVNWEWETFHTVLVLCCVHAGDFFIVLFWLIQLTKLHYLKLRIIMTNVMLYNFIYILFSMWEIIFYSRLSTELLILDGIVMVVKTGTICIGFIYCSELSKMLDKEEKRSVALQVVPSTVFKGTTPADALECSSVRIAFE